MSYPDDLPQITVVFIFVNEALSVILRSVHSLVNHTPPHLLKEIILVDDNSDSGETKSWVSLVFVLFLLFMCVAQRWSIWTSDRQVVGSNPLICYMSPWIKMSAKLIQNYYYYI